MTILNQKEQVVDIQLTIHGRKKLGLGLFSPKYYYFYDDSIIYDYSYLNETEDKNSIIPRILNNSLTFDSLNTFDHVMAQPLGNSKPLNDYAPSWDVFLLKGYMQYDNDASTFYKKTINISDIVYEIKYDNNKEIIINSDYLLIDLKEMNLEDEFKNFEIEIVTFDELSGGKKSGLERKLMFNKKKTNIINDMIYEESELPTSFHEKIINEECVSYYLDVLVDDEIDQEYIIPKEKEKIVKESLYSYPTNYVGPIDPKC